MHMNMLKNIYNIFVDMSLYTWQYMVELKFWYCLTFQHLLGLHSGIDLKDSSCWGMICWCIRLTMILLKFCLILYVALRDRTKWTIFMKGNNLFLYIGMWWLHSFFQSFGWRYWKYFCWWSWMRLSCAQYTRLKCAKSDLFILLWNLSWNSCKRLVFPQFFLSRSKLLSHSLWIRSAKQKFIDWLLMFWFVSIFFLITSLLVGYVGCGWYTFLHEPLLGWIG